jgi:hypothetical protein
MPRHLQTWPAYAGPGIVTGLLGLALLGMALALLVRALRRPGVSAAIPLAEARRYLVHPSTRRLALMVVLSGAYLALLGRGLPYHLTTGGYLAATMLLFGARPWWLVLLVGGVTTAAIALIFNRIFLIPLP